MLDFNTTDALESETDDEMRARLRCSMPACHGRCHHSEGQTEVVQAVGREANVCDCKNACFENDRCVGIEWHPTVVNCKCHLVIRTSDSCSELTCNKKEVHPYYETFTCFSRWLHIFPWHKEGNVAP